MSQIQKIIKNSSSPKLIEDVFEFAKEAYKDKKWVSGENNIEHAVRVASTLDKMGLDPITIAFGLLHDVIDDMPDPIKKNMLFGIQKKFGKEITNLIEKISNLRKIRYSITINLKEKKTLTREKIENLRMMFLAIAGDLRVVLIELVSRIDGLTFLHYRTEEQQKLYAIETLQIFMPIANRLGLSEIKRNLEDLSFSYLFPKKLKWLKSNIKERYEERKRFLKKFSPKLKKYFKKERLKFVDINYRAKSYWSTYLKLTKHDMDFDKIHDLIALRVVVKDIKDCYEALGIIHKYCKPISEEINDYIAKPKFNGYRSLHTNVFCEKDKITEIQIRTEEMQKEAEYGVYAHWSYKEKIDLKKDGEKFKWTKKIPEFWETFKIDFFSNKTFAFTPKGDIIVLSKGSTPIDFAYAVHSDIGDHCEFAKIGGKIVPFSHILKNGDVIEIATNRSNKPSKDWLKFVKTSLAKSQIRKKIAQDELNFAFAVPIFIKKKISEITEKVQKRKKEKTKIKKQKPREIYLAGQKGIMVNMAKCCNPEPNDKAMAYLTKHRAAVLHKTSCKNFQKLAKKFPNKVIKASWK